MGAQGSAWGLLNPSGMAPRAPALFPCDVGEKDRKPILRSGDLSCQTSYQTQPHSCGSNNSSYQLLNRFYLLLKTTLTS